MTDRRPDYNYGMDAELRAKRDASWDPKLEDAVKQWIQKRTGTQVRNLHEDLKSGEVLCKAVGVKYQTSTMPFKQMENISSYLTKCKELGIPQHSLFQTADLYDNTNMTAVVNNLLLVMQKLPA